jgi:putative restriction endonuclease
MALAVSADRGLPVRVIRGLGGDPNHSPSSGYRYDGLYYVESYWLDKGKSGFDIWRFRLVRSPSENPVTNPKPGVPPSGNQRREYATTQRLVRNTAVTQWVKQLYGYQCQVCDVVLHTPTGPYAEGAHLRPVGRPHNGPDEASNVLCLCPNDHVRLDRGVIGLTPNGDVVEIETGSTLGQLTIEPNHGLDFAQAAYHRSIHTA